jgi:hypothetical protein
VNQRFCFDNSGTLVPSTPVNPRMVRKTRCGPR